MHHLEALDCAGGLDVMDRKMVNIAGPAVNCVHSFHGL